MFTHRMANMPHVARFIFQIKQASMKCFGRIFFKTNVITTYLKIIQADSPMLPPR